MTDDAIALRETTVADDEIFFEHQLDVQSRLMAAAVGKDGGDLAAYLARARRHDGDPTVFRRTVLCGGRVAGHVASFLRSGEREVCYWFGREFWGRGAATAALKAFLLVDRTRPLYARVAKDNTGSVRVLRKCGFQDDREDHFFSEVRGVEVEEFVLKLKETV